MWKRCQSIDRVLRSIAVSLLTKQTDVACVLNIPPQCRKALNFPEFKDDDVERGHFELGFKAEACLLFRV